jgi:hypothetical protein
VNEVAGRKIDTFIVGDACAHRHDRSVSRIIRELDWQQQLRIYGAEFLSVTIRHGHRRWALQRRNGDVIGAVGSSPARLARALELTWPESCALRPDSVTVISLPGARINDCTADFIVVPRQALAKVGIRRAKYR